MKRTYIDANVIIAAFQGEESVARRALQVLDDPNREIVVSDYLKLEVLPKPTFLKKREEVEFMKAIFDSAIGERSDVTEADRVRTQYGVKIRHDAHRCTSYRGRDHIRRR